MDAAQPLCSCLLDKIHEQIERTEHLMALGFANRTTELVACPRFPKLGPFPKSWGT